MNIFGLKRGSDDGKNAGLDPSFIELQHDLGVTRMISISGFVLGLFLLLVIGIFLKSFQTNEETLNVFFWALACYAADALTGFLFGIPRVLQKLPELGTSQLVANQGAPRTHSAYELIINTNLDDVSDWLTKIVVGVGLVEMEKIPGAIYRLASMIAGEGRKTLIPLAVAVIIYFTILGFISGYLTTRMFFQRAFRVADLAASGSGTRAIIETQTVRSTTESVSPAQRT